jgi:hypothetical protein
LIRRVPESDPKAYERPPCLERLRRQLDDLDWILARAGYDGKKWKAKVQSAVEEGKLRLDLALKRAGGRRVMLSPVCDPDWSKSTGIGERHFWIEGNHWYDNHALGVLHDELGEKDEREQAIAKLCRLAEKTASRVEVDDTEPLLRAVAKVKELEGLP